MLTNDRRKIAIAYLIVCLQGIGVILLGLFFELLLYVGSQFAILSYNSSFIVLKCALVVGFALMLIPSIKLWLKLKNGPS